jgi:tetratricopeptide (TPR) repeat protein
MFSVVGLLIGLIVGFIGANNINRSATSQIPIASTMPTGGGTGSGNPALPADHPPLGTSSGASNGTTGGAIPQVTAAIEKAKSDPKNYEAQMTAADLYYQIQRFDDAAKYYEAANKLKPGEIEAIIKAGNAYFDGEKYEQAEKFYLQALEKNPKDINVRTDLGLTFYLREPRDIERAIKEYKASLAIDPNHEVTLQNLALAYRDKGDTANLNETLEKIRKINPDNPVLKDPGSLDPS